MNRSSYTNQNRFWIPTVAGLLGSVSLAGIYFAIVSIAESFTHAVQLFWQDRWIVIPMMAGFGIQAALYSILKLKLFLPTTLVGEGASERISSSGATMGASGTTSTLAMAACCAHHITDVLPILGLSAASAFLAKHRLLFLGVGLGTTILGIGMMLVVLIRARQKILPLLTAQLNSKVTS